jgi:hypothetical protein
MTDLLDVSALGGIWTCSLKIFPDGHRDETTNVAWAQGPSIFIDLRQPAGRPDFSHATCLTELTAPDCAWLATQQGFAGVLRQADGFFEWVREIDFHPPTGPDSGRLFWENDILVETGRYSEYREHWHRDEALPRLPCAAARLRAKADGRLGMLIRLGDDFLLARGRPPAMRVSGDSLAEGVAGAATLAEAQALFDCEFAQGRITGDNWQITRSTLPFREKMDLSVDFAEDGVLHLDHAGWEILALEGEMSSH